MSNDWIEIGQLEDIPSLGSRVVETDQGNIALFRTAQDTVFALKDECPHKGGPLSEGIVHGESVACPLHDWKIRLSDGEAMGPDEGCTTSFPIKMEGSTVFLSLEPLSSAGDQAA